MSIVPSGAATCGLPSVTMAATALQILYNIAASGRTSSRLLGSAKHSAAPQVPTALLCLPPGKAGCGW